MPDTPKQQNNQPAALSREEIPEPPEGADPEVWHSIPPEVHREASQVARALFGERPGDD